MKHIFFYQTNIGEIGIVANNGAITNLFIRKGHISQDVVVKETAVIKEAGKQVIDYLSGKRNFFTIPLAPVGTEFQKKVWKVLQDIPFGETRSYKDIARSIGQPKAARAIGMANNLNPILILIPCHRVIGVDGKLVGYAAGLQVKEYLLELEK